MAACVQWRAFSETDRYGVWYCLRGVVLRDVVPLVRRRRVPPKGHDPVAPVLKSSRFEVRAPAFVKRADAGKKHGQRDNAPPVSRPARSRCTAVSYPRLGSTWGRADLGSPHRFRDEHARVYAPRRRRVVGCTRNGVGRRSEYRPVSEMIARWYIAASGRGSFDIPLSAA